MESLELALAVLSYIPLTVTEIFAEELSTSDPTLAPKLRCLEVFQFAYPLVLIEMSPALESMSQPYIDID